MKTHLERIDYSDLIGLPYVRGGATREGLDCVGIGRLALERMGAPLEPGDLPATEDDLQASLFQLGGMPGRSPWIHLGALASHATRLGDIVLSTSPEGSHVGVMVDAPRRLVLTACAPLYRTQEDPDADPGPDGLQPVQEVLVRVGQTFALPARRIRGVHGVYRLAGWSTDKRWGGSR